MTDTPNPILKQEEFDKKLSLMGWPSAAPEFEKALELAGSHAALLERVRELEKACATMLEEDHDLLGLLELSKNKFTALEAELQWHPVSERLPEPNKDGVWSDDVLGVRVTQECSGVEVSCYGITAYNARGNHWLDFFAINHWRPLPPPPLPAEYRKDGV